jgi:hypothetical protein
MVKNEPWRIWAVDEQEEGYVHISLDELEEDDDDNEELAAEKARRRELNDVMVQECIEFRERKEKGARLTHRAAVQDVENTKSELQVIVRLLFSPINFLLTLRIVRELVPENRGNKHRFCLKGQRQLYQPSRILCRRSRW